MSAGVGPWLGCVADDHTGGSDLAAALRRAGLRTVLRFGSPRAEDVVPPCDAVVVALKTRASPVAEAVERSVEAQRWLARLGATRFYDKYCSTFDSTDEGNIGPVADALLDDLPAAPLTLACPASPTHGRTTYQGHLFVGDRLLSDSPMRDHPLTPTTDADLVRVLDRQTPHAVGLLPFAVVRAGVGAVREHLRAAARDGVRHIVVDVLDDADLVTVARAADDLPLLTGGAGLAGAVAATRSGAGASHSHVGLPPGPGVVLAGSCSAATLGQLDHALARFRGHRLDPVATPDRAALVDAATTWLEEHLGDRPVVLYSSAAASEREGARAVLGPAAATILEETLGRLARRAVDLGARRIVVAGGESSGAVTQALGVEQVLVGDEADPGVPWCVTTGDEPVALLLKSGNFGRPDLLVRAMEG